MSIVVERTPTTACGSVGVLVDDVNGCLGVATWCGLEEGEPDGGIHLDREDGVETVVVVGEPLGPDERSDHRLEPAREADAELSATDGEEAPGGLQQSAAVGEAKHRSDGPVVPLVDHGDLRGVIVLEAGEAAGQGRRHEAAELTLGEANAEVPTTLVTEAEHHREPEGPSAVQGGEVAAPQGAGEVELETDPAEAVVGLEDVAAVGHLDDAGATEALGDDGVSLLVLHDLGTGRHDVLSVGDARAGHDGRQHCESDLLHVHVSSAPRGCRCSGLDRFLVKTKK